MVDERVTDGRRIAELLASELHGRADGPLGRVAVTDADPDVAPSVDGALAYRVTVDGEPGGAVYVHPERVRLELARGAAAAAEAARGPDLHARPKAVEPPRTLLFVESGAAVKRAADAVEAAVEAADAAGDGEPGSMGDAGDGVDDGDSSR